MNLAEKLQLLDNLPLFNQLDKADKERLSTMMEARTKPRYSFIYRPGDSSDYVYLLQKGTLKIATHNQEGKEVIKRLIHPEALFGERALVGEEVRRESAQSLKEPVTYCVVKVADFQRIMAGSPSLSQEILQLFG
ncbi:MAG: cyclic nucleotide-binding domain-containing protein, partial [Bacteroidota bacterium]